MSLASMQSIKVTNSLLLNSSSAHSCTSLSTVSKVPFCKQRSTITITCSQAEGPLRRPSIASPPVRPSAPDQNPPPAPAPAPVSAPPPEPTVVGGQNVVTMEFQRQKAKELQQYFKQKKLEEANVGPFFGFIAKNEISNGRNVTDKIPKEYDTPSRKDRDKKIYFTGKSLFGCWYLGICHMHLLPGSHNCQYKASDFGQWKASYSVALFSGCLFTT